LLDYHDWSGSRLAIDALAIPKIRVVDVAIRLIALVRKDRLVIAFWEHIQLSLNGLTHSCSIPLRRSPVQYVVPDSILLLEKNHFNSVKHQRTSGT
jgi:hypothetical protein